MPKLRAHSVPEIILVLVAAGFAKLALSLAIGSGFGRPDSVGCYRVHRYPGYPAMSPYYAQIGIETAI